MRHIKPSPESEIRNEIIKFSDGSQLEVNQKMRNSARKIYEDALSKCIQRLYVSMSDNAPLYEEH